MRETGRMAIFDHLGISVVDPPAAAAQFEPVLAALGFKRFDSEGPIFFVREGEPEILLYPAREEGTDPHVHGRVGWQHLAFRVDSRADVDRLHAIALDAGWSTVRDPKEYPRFSDSYYAAFVEDANGIRIEFMNQGG